MELFNYLNELREIYPKIIYKGTHDSIHFSANDNNGYSEFIILDDGRYTVYNLQAGEELNQLQTKKILENWSQDLILISKNKTKEKTL